jgi:uncharacterized caspase-like protein
VVARENETIYLRRKASLEQKSETSGSSTKTAPAESVPERDEPIQYRAGYGKNWAVAIGINRYQKWPPLNFAVKDAEEVSKRLKRLGFDHVIPLYDTAATQQQILRVLGDELYDKTADNDRVFIFFSGHGQTQALPDGGQMGYIIPVNGDRNHYYSTAISMRQLQDLSDRIRAKHIFYVIDACFSGLMMNARGLVPEPPSHIDGLLQKLTTFKARQVLTAGSQGEQAFESSSSGHGLFTRILLEALDGAADDNRDGYITASELNVYTVPRVLKASQNQQNPLFGRLGVGRGEVVFKTLP